MVYYIIRKESNNMAGNNEIDSVLYKGTISFTNMSGVDIGSLESHVNSAYALTHVAVHKSHYWCHYALTKDSQRVNALMVVSVDYEGEVLNTPEKLGEINVGLSGVVGGCTPGFGSPTIS